MAVRIRATEDQETVQSLDRICFPHDAYKELGDHEIWLAMDEDEPVGYASLIVQDDGAKAFLSRAGVLRSHRGQGIQRRLIQARVSWARKRGIPRLWTYTWAGNIGSLRSLCSQGFLPYYWHRDETCDGGKGATFIYLELKLCKTAK